MNGKVTICREPLASYHWVYTLETQFDYAMSMRTYSTKQSAIRASERAAKRLGITITETEIEE